MKKNVDKNTVLVHNGNMEKQQIALRFRDSVLTHYTTVTPLIVNRLKGIMETMDTSMNSVVKYIISEMLMNIIDMRGMEKSMLDDWATREKKISKAAYIRDILERYFEEKK